ncbi:muts domain V-domain-containing protein, partial [Baffinella frigidus]
YLEANRITEELADSWVVSVTNIKTIALVVSVTNIKTIALGQSLQIDAQTALTFVVSVTNIKTIALDQFLQIDAQTIQSLQILHQDRHPSAAVNGKAKEGLSLFSLLDNTRSPLGRQMLRTWFVRPLLKEEEIAKRLEAGKILVRLRKATWCVSDWQNLTDSMVFSSSSSILVRLRKATASVSDWQNLTDSIVSLGTLQTLCCAEHLSAEDGELPVVLEEVREYFCAKLHNIATLLNSVCDFEESKSRESFITAIIISRKRLSVSSGVDEELDEEKRTYEGLGDFLEQVAQQEVNSLPESDSLRISVVFFPQLGYLVVSPNDGSPPLPAMDLHFNTDEWLYWKSDRMRDLDEQVGDIYGRICDKEFIIINQVREKILSYHAELLRTCNITATLAILLEFAIAAVESEYLLTVASKAHILLGFAIAAVEREFCEPMLVKEPRSFWVQLGSAIAAVEREFCEPMLVKETVLYIEGGRHPLCECVVETFVPNDTVLDSNNQGEEVLSIVTGPNYSGKSVYLKQCALIAFMAHLGSWVPATRCQVGLVDRIFSRVQSRETCAVASSSFALDLNQVAVMLRGSTPNSLLLLDEFGKVIATHFDELTKQNLLPDSGYLGIRTMSVMADRPQGSVSGRSQGELGVEAEDDLIFLYRLVVERARLVSEQLANHQPVDRIDLQNQDMILEVVERARLVSEQLANHQLVNRIDLQNQNQPLPPRSSPEPGTPLDLQNQATTQQRAERAVGLLQHLDANSDFDVRRFLHTVADNAALRAP